MNVAQHLTWLGLDAELIKANLPSNLTLSLQDGVLFVCDKAHAATQVFVDFLQGPMAYRASQHLGAEHLIKACKIKSQDHISVLDATCGMGKDSFMLSESGFQVTATESNPLVHALLSDGLKRLRSSFENKGFELFHLSAEQMMQKRGFDVIYLDPMFPAKVKTAKTKKDMQIFQSIHQLAEDNAEHLLNTALHAACQRVVIKRPIKAPPLINKKPTFQIVGKTCQFQAYHLS